MARVQDIVYGAEAKSPRVLVLDITYMLLYVQQKSVAESLVHDQVHGMEAARAGEHRYTHCRATVYDHNTTNAVSEVPARTGCGVYGIRVAKGGVRFTIRIDRC